jgi:serine/threonine-protein kinase
VGDLVGKKIAHFRVDAKLGEGGMGVVYKATDEQLRRVVALKVLPENFAENDERRRRFLREARSLAAVSHPNIATVYDVGDDGGRAYIVMELVAGESLRQRLARGPLEVDEALRIAGHILRGLGRAHERGLVHRDLKPDNVMISPDGDAKILDFGLAKLREAESAIPTSDLESQPTVTHVTLEPMVMGTPGYMALEQLGGGAVDARADVFAFGVVLYEMLTGERPFKGKNFLQIAAEIEQGPPSVTKQMPGADAQIDALLVRCLRKSPEERFADARAVLTELDAITRTPGGATPKIPGPSDAAAPRRRLPVVAVLVALGAIILTAVAARSMSGSSVRSPPAISPSTSAPTTAAAQPRAITDWPAPPTSSPAAGVAYADALRALRDGRISAALEGFTHATDLDPRFGAAALRLYFLRGQPLLAEKIVAVRDSLVERDRILLQLVEGSLHGQQRAAADALAQARPEDAEALYWAATSSLWDSGPGRLRALDWLRHALELDPAFAAALATLSEAELSGGADFPSLANLLPADPQRAIETANRCLAAVPGSEACLMARAMAHSLSGQCDALEDDANVLTRAVPSSPSGYAYLTVALMHRGQPVPALEQIARLHAGAFPEAQRPSVELRDRVALALYAGDFVAAEAALRALEKANEDSLAETDHFGAFLLYRLAAEEGDTGRRLALGQDYFRKMAAWSDPSGGSYARVFVVRDLVRARLLSEHDAQTAIEYLRKIWADGLISADYPPVRYWLFTSASAVESREEALEAMSAAPADLLPYRDVHPGHRGNLGRALALAGETEKAIPYLRANAAWCGPEYNWSATYDTAHWVTQMQLRLVLGRALEQSGDRAGACDAYAAVLARWGHAKPRSVTADEARARATKLGCALTR